MGGVDTTNEGSVRGSTRAVSPVSAVVALVATTVILASVVTAAVFVTGDVETVQQAATRFNNVVDSYWSMLP